MINFFRRIRQALLQGNKFRKYTLYAIGEIALVMIGILLALQVNNWNENQKSRNREMAFLQRLHSDIAADTSMLSAFINIVEIKDQCLRSIHNGTIDNFHYSESNQTYDIFLTRFRSLPIISDNTFLEVTSSGNWSIIQGDQLKEKIFDYYRYNRNRKDALEIQFSKWPEIISQLLPADGVYDPGYIDDYALPVDQINKTIKSILSEKETLIPHINAELQYTVKQRVSFLELKERAIELLHDLDNIVEMKAN